MIVSNQLKFDIKNGKIYEFVFLFSYLHDIVKIGENMKKKIWLGVVFIFGSILVVLAIFGVNQYLSRKNEQKKVNEIKEHYALRVKTLTTKKLYRKENKRYVEVGTVSEGINLPLEEMEIDDSTDTFFKISGMDYYIDYQDLEKSSYTSNNSFQNFLSTKVVTTKKVELYDGERLAFSIDDSLSFDVMLQVEDTYYVKFLDNIYSIGGDFSIQDKQDIPRLERLSTFTLSSDIGEEKVREVFSLFQEQGYTTITYSDFLHWIKGEGDLPDKKILLLGNQKQKQELQELVSAYSYSLEIDTDSFFQEGDQQLQVGDTEYFYYLITNDTSKERIMDMLNGVKYIENPIQEVAVLNYHFFYDEAKGDCTESICISMTDFRKQLDYLKENNFKVLTMQEFNDWMDGKIEFDQKSVLITIDDGAAGTFDLLPAILEEYQMPATLFLISGWWPVSRYSSSSYLEIESHGHDLHHNHYCINDRCGYKTLLLSKEELKADLNTSIKTIGSQLAFCYPFYQTNTTLVEAVKESGFSLAFVGGNKKATRKSNKYYVPRYIIYKNTSLASFKNMVN